MGSRTWEGQYVSPEVLEELFPGLTLEEALAHQESLLESLKISGGRQTTRSSDSQPRSRHGHSRGESSYSGGPGGLDYQSAIDEALARSLQDLEDVEDIEVHHISITERHRVTPRNTERAAVGTSHHHHSPSPSPSPSLSPPDAHQSDIDPDDMSYEEILALEESSGAVTQGLTETQIASLPCYKLKSGGGFFSSKKIDLGECVICVNEFKNRDTVISLTCAHQYHKDCIEPWLKDKKNCPMCKKEVVFD